MDKSTAQLIRDMRSADNATALRAVNELRANGFLLNGSLRDSTLTRADLQGADLSGADLWGTFLNGAKLMHANLTGTKLLCANLSGVNLWGAIGLQDEQLAECSQMVEAIMRDGKFYDGRYNLVGDFFAADKDDPESLRLYYGVSPNDYNAGQEWAKQHAPLLHMHKCWQISSTIQGKT